MLVEDGLVLVKLWFSIDRVEQQERLTGRVKSPLKRWKLSTVDQKAQEHWQRFTDYKEAMFARTASPHAPWVVVRGNCKKTARLEGIRHVLGRVDYSDKGQPGLRLEPDPEVVTVLRWEQPQS